MPLSHQGRLQGGPKTHVHPEPVKVTLLRNRVFAVINKEEVVLEQRGPQSTVTGFLIREKFVRKRHRERPGADRGTDWRDVATSQGTPEPPGAGRDKEGCFPAAVLTP